MKIAFVCPFFGADAAGGAEHAARSLAQQLVELPDFQVEILTTCLKDLTTGIDNNHHPPGVCDDGQLTVRRFPVAQADMQHFGLLNDLILNRIPLTPAEEAQFMTRHVTSLPLIEYITGNNDQYDFFCFIPYLFGTSIYGVPAVPAKSILIPCFHDEGYAHLQLTNRMISHAHRIVYNTSSEQRIAASIFGDIAVDKGVVAGLGMSIPPPGNADRFRRQFNIPAPFALYVGRRDTTKNVHNLIHDFIQHKTHYPSELKLVLIGPAPLPMQGAHPDIIDLGFVSPQQKTDAYAAADIFCQPSLNESFSYVLMESWLESTPALVHEQCDVTCDHVKASQGGLYYKSSREFSACLEKLLSTPDLAQTMGQAGRRYVLANYQWNHVLQIYREQVFR